MKTVKCLKHFYILLQLQMDSFEQIMKELKISFYSCNFKIFLIET